MADEGREGARPSCNSSFLWICPSLGTGTFCPGLSFLLCSRLTYSLGCGNLNGFLDVKSERAFIIKEASP